MADHHEHDSHDEHGYVKRCYCQKCVKTFDDWKHKKQEHGCSTCKRRCRTICEYVCEQPKTTVYHWGFKKEFEGKWERVKAYDRPHDCKEGCKH